jgi:hypothetical protein
VQPGGINCLIRANLHCWIDVRNLAIFDQHRRLQEAAREDDVGVFDEGFHGKYGRVQKKYWTWCPRIIAAM